MAYLNDEVFDQGLDWVDANGTRIDICSAEPTTYAEATSTYTLGNKTGLNVGATENGDSSGRKVVVPAITDGTVTGTDTATHFALTDGSSVLIAVQALPSSQAVTSGNTFTLGAIDITIPDPA
jgi:archaellum component FlaF (FlaF/FlaG flagellin family)